MKKLHTLIFVLLVWSFSFSQQASHFTVNSGLPSNHVYRITQDTLGFIWMITDKGIVKYNGNEFKTFTTKEGLPVNDIWDIRITPDNKIWYFSKSSKLGYIKNDSVYAFPSHKKKQIFFPRSIGQSGNEVFFLNLNENFFLKDNLWQREDVQDSTQVWFSILHPVVSKTRNELGKIIVKDKKNTILTTVNTPLPFKTLKKQGQINDSLYYWIYDKSYSILNLNTLQFVSQRFGVETELIRLNNVNNSLQFSGNDYVFLLDKSLRINRTIAIDKKYNSHFSFIDKQGNTWVATSTQGVYFLPKPKEGVKTLLYGEKCNRINLVKGKLIATVHNKGFYVYDTVNHYFKPYIKASDYIVRSGYLPELKKEFYITNKKIIIQSDQERKTYSIAYGNEIAQQLIYLNDSLYGNTSYGINVMNPEDLTIVKRYFQNGIRDISVMNNRLYMATANGIKVLKNNHIFPVFTQDSVLQKPILKIVPVDNNKMVVCTDGFGAYLTNFKQTQLLPQTDFLTVQSAYVTDNSIWLATNEGLKHYQKNENQYLLSQTITQENGLSLPVVNDVFLYRQKIFTTTNMGITLFDPITEKPPRSLLHIYFSDVVYNHKRILDKKVLFTSDNNLTVAVSGIDFSQNNNKLHYQYRLLPLQKKWTTTTSKSVSFNNLPPANYQLDIVSGTTRNSLSFTIKPLWWQRVWVKALFVVLILSLVIFAVLFFNRRKQRRIQHKLQQEKQLVQIQLKALRSQMNPHFVFNSLSAIQYYINENDLETSDLYLVKFSKLIRRFFDLSKEEEIPLSEEINLLTNYLEIEKLRFKDKFTFSIDVQQEIDTKKTTIPTMLLQPIVENAINHGIFNKMDTGNVAICFKKTPSGELMVEIIDDGVGMVNTQSKTGTSKKSSGVLKDRLYFLNHSGRWEISYLSFETFPNKKDKGNTVQFIIKKTV